MKKNMTKRLENAHIRVIKLAHVAVLCLVVFTISILHMFPSPFLDFLRMPSLLRLIDPLIGNVYPFSFYAYHGVLYFFFALIIVDLVSFKTRSRNIEVASAALSSVGAVLMVFLIGLFLRIATFNGIESIIVQGMVAYFALCTVLFALDITTFLTERRLLQKQ